MNGSSIENGLQHGLTTPSLLPFPPLLPTIHSLYSLRPALVLPLAHHALTAPAQLMPRALTHAWCLHCRHSSEKNGLNKDMCMCVNVFFALELKWVCLSMKTQYKVWALLGFACISLYHFEVCGKFRNVACCCCGTIPLSCRVEIIWHRPV